MIYEQVYVCKPKVKHTVLSYKTVFYPSCRTIEKYTPHTDKLEIIYCFGSGNKRLKDNHCVGFTNISEFYQQLYDVGDWRLVDVIESFVSKYEHLYEK